MPEDAGALVTTFEGSHEWARTARTGRTLAVESLAASVLRESGTTDADHAHERERMCALIDGLSQRIRAGWVSHADATAGLRRHVADLFGQALHEDGDAA